MSKTSIRRRNSYFFSALSVMMLPGSEKMDINVKILNVIKKQYHKLSAVEGKPTFANSSGGASGS